MMRNMCLAVPQGQVKGRAYGWLKCMAMIMVWLGLSVSPMQAQEMTDGYRIFLEDDKDYVWDKRNEAFNHVMKMPENQLLVRLKDEKKRILYMEERGKMLEANQLRKKTDADNQEMIDGFKKYFDYCDVYFYYPSDANEIFKNKKFDLVYTDLETRATGLKLEYMPYVMKYETVAHLRYSDAEKINLYSWNHTQLERIERFYFPRMGIGRWTRRFKKRMKKQNKEIPEDLNGLHLLIYGFNGACHGISTREE